MLKTETSVDQLTLEAATAKKEQMTLKTDLGNHRFNFIIFNISYKKNISKTCQLKPLKVEDRFFKCFRKDVKVEFQQIIDCMDD